MSSEMEFNLPGLPRNEGPRPGDPDYNAFEDEDSPFYGLSPNWSPTGNRPIPTVRCARIINKGTDEERQCGNRAIRGTGLTPSSEMDAYGNVVVKPGKGYCRMHGGSLPNVKAHSEKIIEAARLALSDSTPDAVTKLVKLVNSDTAPEQVQLNAAKEILDRAGLKGGPDMTVEVNLNEMKPSDKLSEKLAAMRKPAELEDMGEVVEEETE